MRTEKTRMGKVYLVFGVVTLLASAVAQAGPRILPPWQAPVPAPHSDSRTSEGTDTGNGGDTVVLAPPSYQRATVGAWCSDVQGWIADALQTAKFLHSAAASRQYMAQAIDRMLDAFESNSLPFQPLTYSLLLRAQAMNQVFPMCETRCEEFSLANRAAELVLTHMLNLGIQVNAKFDVPQYIPYYEHARCRDCPAYDFKAFNSNYIENVRAVLNTFFGPAYANNSPGNLLEAMGADQWELRAQWVILDWIVSDFRGDLFNRSFQCVAARMDEVKRKLDRHLAGERIWDDMRMVQYVRASLADVMDLLNTSQFGNDGVYYCRRGR